MHRLALAVLVLSLATPAGFAQQSSSSLVAPEFLSSGGSAPPAAYAATTMPPSASRGAFSGVGIGVKAGLLGAGIEVATPLSYHVNIRGGGNFMNYSDTLTSDGISYNAALRFRSAEASVDWFPWAKGFHVSPGALLYNGNQITGNASVPGGQTFTLNGTTYTSSTTDPVTGTGGVTMNKAAPKLTVGWGNLVPRSGRHFSVPVELGAAYIGDPKVAVNLAGTACYTYEGTPYCSNVATNSMIQSNLAAQVLKLNNDAKDARFFPLLSLGFAYRF
ncbi:MAG: hypothetical protein WA891_00580 [Acidobacteriaceae bacterium]|jgi:hypothetical protein